MDGVSFAVGFSAGVGVGIAVGIAIGLTDRRSLLNRLKRRLDQAVTRGQVVVNDADGNAITGQQLIHLLQQPEQ